MPLLWINPEWPENERKNLTMVHSDTLFLQSPDQYEAARLQTVGDTGQDWNHVPPAQMESFLKARFNDDKITLQVVGTQKNVSTGFPVTIFGYENRS